MSTHDLISELREIGVRLALADGELKVSAPKGVMTPDMRVRLIAAKAEIIELLSDAAAASQPPAAVIEPADRSQSIPLSYPQQRMWFLEEFEQGSSIYNIPWAARLHGEVNSAALEGAINDLIQRHELLRTTFITANGLPVQQIHAQLKVTLDRIDMQGCDDAALQEALTGWSTEHFKLATGPLLHSRLIKLGANDHVLLLVIHHIISDGWSLEILQRELIAFYTARCENRSADLPALPIQYADYAAWQRKRLSEGEQSRQLNYWKEKLRSLPSILELPTDRPRPDSQSYKGARLQQTLSAELTTALKNLARAHNATLFMVLMAAYHVLLGRYSGQDDVAVGSPIAGRKQTELEGLIGVFLNTLVMRGDLTGNPSFVELLDRTRTTALDAFDHQDLPFEKLVDELQPARELSYSPVFQVLFMLQNAPQSEQPMPGLQFGPVKLDYGTAKFDLTLALGEVDDHLVAEIEYSTDLFDAVSITSMLEHYNTLLTSIVRQPTTPIDMLDMLSNTERSTLLHDWNNTARVYPAEVTLQSLLEQQVAATPDALALTFGAEQLSYAELNARSNQLAHWLIDAGVATDELVGVCMERSVEMVVALLGIVKAGAAYVPLDPEYPQQRLEHMLEDAGTRLLLSQSTVHAILPAHNAQLLLVDEQSAELAELSTENPTPRAGPQNLAYAIFTSGSTGRPKGVMNEHRGICNRLQWMQDQYTLAASDRVLQKTPFSFDVSVWEFFWPLISGATLVVAKPGGHKDPEYLAAVISQQKITTLHFVPSMLQVFLQDPTAANCTSLQRVICSGEALSHDLQARFYATFTHAELHNLYGPTEAVIDVTFWACPRESSLGMVPIGKPVANTSLYIVDKSGNPSPIGVPGELWIGGIQVARGYVGRPELTAERFIADPFSDQPDARVYRSGDLVRYRNDGNIEFLGRIDHQIKLRGFRIELGEIEATLDAQPGVKQSLVMLREDVPGDKRLVGYITGDAAAELDIPTLRHGLQDALPDYMVPAAFVVLDKFPLLPNGKADRKALPEPEGRREVESVYVAPRDAHEKILEEIWCELLRIERIGIHDNYFELGGDSILSIQIVTRAVQAGLPLTPKQIFKHQTIAELAAVVGDTHKVMADQGDVTGPVELTPILHWFFAQQDTDVHHFNQSVVLELTTPADTDKLDAALRLLVAHHDALRLTATQTTNGWSLHQAAVSSAPLLTIGELSPEQSFNEQMEQQANAVQAGLDLSAGRLLAARLFTDGTQQQLLLVIHHLAVDGLSWRILLEDLESAYQQILQGRDPQLPPKSSSFQSWTRHLQEYAPDARAALPYWSQLANTASTPIPTDFSTAANTVASARTVHTELDAVATKRLLQEVPKAFRTQINDVLLTALARALSNWTQQDNAIIDLEGHGREELFDDLDIGRTIGWFTSLYPVALTAGGTPEDNLKQVKEILRNIPNRGIDFGVLRYLDTDSDSRAQLATAPLGQIIFNYLGQFDQTVAASGLFKPANGPTGAIQSANRERQHLIEINGNVYGGQLRMSFTYSCNRHAEATVKALADSFNAELKELIALCAGGKTLGYTPSDFPLAAINQQQLDELIATYPDASDIYPITPMEHAMLFQSMLSTEAAAEDQLYLTQVVWTIEGNIDGDAFTEAWAHVLQRHEVLRSSFHLNGLDQPLAIVHNKSILPVVQHDWSELNTDEQQQRLTELLHDDQQQGFNLQATPLMRVYLLRFGTDDFRFIWSHHHIIIDGWSIPLVLDDLFAAYNALSAGNEVQFTPAPPYRNYVEWLLNQDEHAARDFWTETLAGFYAPTPLPAASKPYRAVGGSGSFAKTYHALPADQTQQFRQLARQLRVTVNTLAQGMWALLISRYTGEQDIVFGATSSGRPPELNDVEKIVGLFLNALPVRIQLDPKAEITDWFATIQTQQLAARQHEYAAAVDIQNWSEIPRGTGLFNSLFVFENYPEASSLWSDRNTLKVRDMQADSWSNFPLSAAVSISNELVLRLSYDTEYFSDTAVSKLGELFAQTVQRLLTNPQGRIHDLLIPEPQVASVDPKCQHRSTRKDLAEDLTETSLAAAFEQQVARTPLATAIITAGESLSYTELNERANQIAHTLINTGLAIGDHVGLLLGQDGTMLSSLLGVLKAGLVYVPLDPNSPTSRLDKIVLDANLQVVISDPLHMDTAMQLGSGLAIISTAQAAISSTTNPALTINPDSLAYILFTSGSTGTPKGVMQTHRNALHHIRTYSNAMQIGPDDRLTLFAPYGFDAAVMDIYSALFNGATLCPLNIKEQNSARDIQQQLQQLEITVFHSTPTVFRFIFEENRGNTFAAIRLVVLGGEASRAADLTLFKQHCAQDAEFCNLMGATEYSLAMLYFADHSTVLNGTALPLGASAGGAEIILQDATGQINALAGELCIRSAYVMPGYWQDSERTAAVVNTGPQSVYRTGDLCRYAPDGQLLFAARNDNQIKVRGNRIEPGEIEAALLLHPQVEQCVVILRQDDAEDPRLIAYCVSRVQPQPGDSELRNHLQAQLPDYMLPAAFVLLNTMPLTANGKIDRRALPSPEFQPDAEHYQAPRTELETTLAGLWAAVLGVEQVGINDDFFILGGHSLLATKLISRIRDQFGTDAELRMLFSYPTIAEFAPQLESAAVSTAQQPVIAIPHTDGAPLSFSQQRLWFLDQLEGDNAAYHMFSPVRMRGQLNTLALEAAVNDLIARHEMLRTTFVEREGVPMQLIAAAQHQDIEKIAMPGADAAAITAQIAALVRVEHDLLNGPLFRTYLLEIAPDDHVFVIIIHHILSDVWTMELMYRDTLALYRQHCGLGEANLPELPVQYADYAIWQHKLLNSDAYDQQLVYWQQKLAGAPPTIDLPIDRPRPPVQTFAGNATGIHISAELSSALTQLGQQQGATLFMVLQAAFDVLLARYSGETDIVIGTPATGRRQTELENLIGFFLNMLVLRADLSADPSFNELLRDVRTTTLDAFANQDLPFERLVEELQPARDPSRAPLFQVMFTVVNPQISDAPFPDLTLEAVNVEFQTAKFDLFMALTNHPDGIGAHLEYNTDLFDTRTAEQMLEHFVRLLEAIVANPDSAVSSLPMLTSAERQKLIVDLNKTAADYDHTQTLHGLFEQNALLYGDRDVVRFAGRGLGYAQIEQGANQLAHRLQALGAGPNVPVAICMQRSAEVLINLLGILKSGSPYVPLDPDFLSDRLRYMLEDSGASILIADADLTSIADGLDLHVISPADQENTDWLSTPPNVALEPDSLAYMIYTSGSTGKPKGVPISHQSIVNNLLSMIQTPGIDSHDRLLALTTLSFDISILELFGSLAAGATIVMVDRVTSGDGYALVDVIEQEQITLLQATPATWRMLFQANWNGNKELTALCGGEAMDHALARDIASRCKQLWNMYGPTETTIWSTCELIPEDVTQITVGKPIANYTCYILDPQDNPVPIGVTGELCIGGHGVAPGYLNLPELSAEKFVTDPFRSNERIYRSGDLARFLPDGRIDIIGRTDFQVKLRGFRIELGEIEATLVQLDDIEQAVVMVREDTPDDQRLVAYLRGTTTALTSDEKIRTALNKALPEYMVPAAFVHLDAFPLTPNNKVDRKQLPAPDWEDLRTEYVAPRNATETTLTNIWAEVLKVEQVGIHDDFFALGGHSLLATQAAARIRDALNIQVELRLLFSHPTVADFALQVTGLDSSTAITAIEVTEHSNGAPLSFGQQRLWFLNRLEPDSSNYNIGGALQLNGPLNSTALEAAFNDLVARHESLRTIFATQDDQPVQQVLPSLQIPLTKADLRGQSETAVRTLVQAFTQLVFDLEQGPLLRLALLQVADNRHIVVISMHHIVSDAWSNGIFMHELTAGYTARCIGQPAELEPLPIQYPDFAIWQREHLSGAELERQVNYWSNQLAGAPAALDLPFDRPRPPVQTYNGGTLLRPLSQELTKSLQQLANTEHCSLFMVLLAGYSTLLSRYTGEQDIVIGSPIAGRQRSELEHQIGIFINMLVLRCDLSANPSITELLQQVKETTFDAFAHQDLPFEKLVEELQPARDMSRSPLFQVAMILQNAPREWQPIEDLQINAYMYENKSAKFDLTVEFIETDEGLLTGFNYNTDLFDHATIERLADHLCILFAALAKRPNTRISDLPLLSANENQQILSDWNATTYDYPATLTVHQTFEQQVARTPDAIALWVDGETLSYAELNRRANQLATYLIECDAGPETLIGICVEREAWMITGMLAILKAGSAYVPLDPNYPADRVQFMLEDSQAPIVLTQSSLVKQLPPSDSLAICLDSFDWGDSATNLANPPSTAVATDLAYVIYTSGSTGKPKGVAIEHRNTVALIQWAKDVFEPTEFASVLASTSVCFDLSVFEIFCTLAVGGRVVLTRDALALPELPADLNVTLINTVPSAIAELVRMNGIPASVQTVNLAGEPLSTELADAIYATGTVQNVNDLYGPSEDTTYSTWTRRAPGAAPTIGVPIYNTQAYVLDNFGNPVPTGAHGELYLGGAGVSRGYLNQPELTAEKYVIDNFAVTTTGRLYRTGDKVRHKPDGQLEFMGRIDQQIKLRGFRIELGEIESNLRASSAVKDAIVMVREDTPGDQRLVAYITAAIDADPETHTLREQLRTELPDYMIPQAFVMLDEIPLTPNGKVDRKALPAPEWQAEADYVAPRNQTEATLAAIWANVLHLEQPGIHDDFFALGGHSLLAMQLASRIRTQLNAEIPLLTLFNNPTIAGLAQHIKPATDTSGVIQITDRSLPLAMSYAQQRLWFLEIMEPGTATYNVPFAIRLEGSLDSVYLQQAIDNLVSRHESLRTVFDEADDTPVQIISRDIAVPLEQLDLRNEDDTSIRLAVSEVAHRPFDLQTGPLLRVAAIQTAAETYTLVLCMHHIICDAWSQSVLFSELASLYDACRRNQLAQLPPLPLQYADYAVWQRAQLDAAETDRQLDYWRDQLADAPPLLDLPLDHPRPAVETHNGASVAMQIKPEQANALKHLARSSGNTPFTLCLTAFNILLARYSGEHDVVIGTPVSGRNRTELEGIIGFFLNTLAIRCDTSGNPSFNQLVAQVRENSLKAFDHQDLPFEKLVEELQPARNLSHAPIFQVLFVYTQAGMNTGGFSDLQTSAAELEFTGAKFDLQLTLHEEADNLTASLLYNTDLFDRATIERMLGHYDRLLAGIVANPKQSIDSLQLLDPIERQQVTEKFNDTARDYSVNSVVELVESRVALTPDAIALSSESIQWSYSEINSRANRLARFLQENGATAGKLIGICAERGPDVPVAILAVLKTGAAYIPIDAAYPSERIEYMLENSQAPLLLTQTSLRAELPTNNAVLICLDEFDWETADDSNLQQTISPADTAYTIYTSGSTGQPKGVSLPHAGLANLLQWQHAETTLNQPARTLQFASFSFDVSFQEVFSTWYQGGTLIMIDELLRRDLPALASFIAAEKVERLFLPFAALQPLVDCFLDEGLQDALVLQDIVVAGEQLQITAALRKLFLNLPDAHLHNQYGPSETHVVTAHTLSKSTEHWSGLPPIGRPIANTRVYVLSEQLEPVPIGVSGELYIGGVQVASGYLHRPDLTAEKFISDPYSIDPSAHLYRTGDRVRWLSNGELEYLGRTDDQVKWRGFRIEPGEIETCLIAHPAVNQAVVMLREDEPGDIRLAAYVVAESGQTIDVTALRAHIKSLLPEFMLPSHFMTLAELPLTPSGKLARRQLPAPVTDRNAISSEQQLSNQTEREVAAIWQSLLKVEAIGLDDNFFDLGGHSLLTIKLTRTLATATGRQLTIADVFENPTVRELALILKDAEWKVSHAGKKPGLLSWLKGLLGG